MYIKLASSILSADFAHLAQEVAAAEAAGADYIHVDVMDGHFVPQITMGPLVVEVLRKVTGLPLDVHLMVEEPQKHLQTFAEAGADILTVHQEAEVHLHRTVEMIRCLGVKPGVSLNPMTPIAQVEEVLPYVDLVLLMTVNPGFGGQEFIPSMLEKIEKMRRLLDEKGLNCELEVDGGINAETAPQVVAAGARVLVAGEAVFGSREEIGQAIKALRESVETHPGAKRGV
jgi:ribulose-phosphate 3-epimerase